MSTELWQWLPMLVPFDALPRIAGELAGEALRGPEPDQVTSYAATTNPGLVRTVVRRWSGSSISVETRQHVHEYSERGERPSEESTWEARIDWDAKEFALLLDGTPWGRSGYPRVLGSCAYRTSGAGADREALERRWLAIIERDFFNPRWPEHPLVPASFREPLASVALATPQHQGTRGQLGARAHRTAFFHTSGDPSWGMIVAGDRALPVGPLPRSPNIFVVNLERPSGAPRREAVDLLKALVGAAARVERVLAESGSTSGAVGNVSLSSMPDRVNFATWRGAGWIVRSQLGFKSAPARTSRHGAFELEWAIQSERGSFALFGRQTQSHESDRETLTLCVVARWPRWTYLRHVRRVFAADGWSWLKLHPNQLWW